MVRKLWLLRHGDAEPHGSKDDALRELTDEGRREAAWAGAALASIGAPGTVLTSPRTRAMQTAAIAASRFGAEPAVEAVLGGGFRGEDALELVTRRPDTDLLLVGHMPDVSLVVAELAGANVGFRTGGLALLRGEGNRWELASLLRPRETRAIAGD